ncbi:MAG: outer membrane lipoprotein-sorting protein [Myxococcales bacterium]|jgi:hypothetical protein
MKTNLHLAACLALLSSAPALAAEEDAQALMEKVFSRASWKDMHGKARLVLTNKRGDTKAREIEMWSKKNERDESRMLMRFQKPADVRGTGFLMIEHKDGDDDRRLFLPALRRVNRISASGSGGNFMSSDFTYYDIGRPKLSDWKYTFAGTKEVLGVECKAVEGVASSPKVVEDTGYSKVVWCVDPKDLVVVGADYFDKSGRMFKQMLAVRIEKINEVPFATHMKMSDVTSGHTSEMVFSDLKTDAGVEESIFTERNLKAWTH